MVESLNEENGSNLSEGFESFHTDNLMISQFRKELLTGTTEVWFHHGSAPSSPAITFVANSPSTFPGLWFDCETEKKNHDLCEGVSFQVKMRERNSTKRKEKKLTDCIHMPRNK